MPAGGKWVEITLSTQKGKGGGRKKKGGGELGPAWEKEGEREEVAGHQSRGPRERRGPMLYYSSDKERGDKQTFPSKWGGGKRERIVITGHEQEKKKKKKTYSSSHQRRGVKPSQSLPISKEQLPRGTLPFRKKEGGGGGGEGFGVLRLAMKGGGKGGGGEASGKTVLTLQKEKEKKKRGGESPPFDRKLKPLHSRGGGKKGACWVQKKKVPTTEGKKKKKAPRIFG